MKTVGWLILLLPFVSCKDKYLPSVSAGGPNHLVVEGILTSGDSSTTSIRLSRTNSLKDSSIIVFQKGATVKIESVNGESYQLTEHDSGNYSINNLHLSLSDTYRLYINISGKEYFSDYVPLVAAPDIDSIGLYLKNRDATIYISTHDDLKDTHYYRWDYVATWEYHSALSSLIRFNNADSTMTDRPANSRDTLYKCWHTERSTNISVATTVGLSEDKIFQFPLIYIPADDERLGVKYSAYIQQYALTKEAYTYWSNLKKITEQLGTVFGPLPSELPSNIHCKTDPAESVIGYFSASTIVKKRAFFNPPLGWRFFFSAIPDTIKMDSPVLLSLQEVKEKLSSLFQNDKNAIPVKDLAPPYRYLLTTPWCGRCTTHGGTNIMPPFWPPY